MTKVLVVDDSALMRKLLGTVLREAGFEVETAHNGADGVAKLTEWEPDVVTLDINMPEMDGLTALSLMMQARPTPVVMVSSLTKKGAMATLEALALGAVDFIAKPGGTISLSIDEIGAQLIQKVRAAARAKVRAARQQSPERRTPRVRSEASLQTKKLAVVDTHDAVPGVVIIGVSTGGPRTLEDILPLLPASFPWPVLLVQHMPGNFTEAFAERLDRMCELKVREVDSPMRLESGHVYLAQGGVDMVMVERLKRLVVQPHPADPEHLWHPSVDVLAASVLKLLAPQQVVGVLLTGMGNDGAATLASLKASGGRTIAESAETAVVFGMPQELIERGGASLVLPSTKVARQLCAWIQ